MTKAEALNVEEGATSQEDTQSLKAEKRQENRFSTHNLQIQEPTVFIC